MNTLNSEKRKSFIRIRQGKEEGLIQGINYNNLIRDSIDSDDCKFIFILVADKLSPERRKVIEKWNREWEKEREDERRKKEAAEAKMNFIFLQQKIQEELNKKKNNLEENKDK